MSHPSRGGWIEIQWQPDPIWVLCRPTPHGVGGLKFDLLAVYHLTGGSHPSRGGWIEISSCNWSASTRNASHPSRGGWIEISEVFASLLSCMSHPSRGGWIEMRKRKEEAVDLEARPTPHGVGGLKCSTETVREKRTRGPTPHGVGGLKCITDEFNNLPVGPTPHGVGGLKFLHC